MSLVGCMFKGAFSFKLFDLGGRGWEMWVCPKYSFSKSLPEHWTLENSKESLYCFRACCQAEPSLSPHCPLIVLHGRSGTSRTWFVPAQPRDMVEEPDMAEPLLPMLTSIHLSGYVMAESSEAPLNKQEVCQWPCGWWPLVNPLPWP